MAERLVQRSQNADSLLIVALGDHGDAEELRLAGSIELATAIADMVAETRTATPGGC